MAGETQGVGQARGGGAQGFADEFERAELRARLGGEVCEAVAEGKQAEDQKGDEPPHAVLEEPRPTTEG